MKGLYKLFLAQQNWPNNFCFRPKTYLHKQAVDQPSMRGLAATFFYPRHARPSSCKYAPAYKRTQRPCHFPMHRPLSPCVRPQRYLLPKPCFCSIEPTSQYRSPACPLLLSSTCVHAPRAPNSPRPDPTQLQLVHLLLHRASPQAAKSHHLQLHPSRQPAAHLHDPKPAADTTGSNQPRFSPASLHETLATSTSAVKSLPPLAPSPRYSSNISELPQAPCLPTT